MIRLGIAGAPFIIAVALIAGCVTAQKKVEVDTRNHTAIFQANFAESQLDLTLVWHLEGRGKARIDDGRLALQEDGAGVVLWLRRDLPSDMRLQFDLSFSNNRGIGVFFIAARGVAGGDIIRDLPKRTGKYEEYIMGKINCYGFSLHRFFPDGRHNVGTNIRKNSGAHVVNHVEPDPITKADQTYHVAIQKVGGHLRLWVDGNLVHDWEDETTHGDVLKGGKIGFRLRGHPSCIMYLDNISITSPSETTEPKDPPDEL